MNLKILLFLLTLVFVWNHRSYAQYENIWAFGANAGIDFNKNPPQAIETAISTSEGSAAICDASGQLLFYTDGTTVFDRNHRVMPDGNYLPGLFRNITGSTTQGALIVPMPGHSNLYYIFSLGENESSVYQGNLYYSVVDMSLNNGLGDVVTGRKGILLSRGLTEHMTAVSGNNCNIWLLVLSRADHTLKSYNIDFKGIDTIPVVSPKVAGGGVHNGILGSLDVSPDRSQLAIAQGNLAIYDFDINTGRINQPFILDSNFAPYYYGVCFSPDNSKLYGTTQLQVAQYDLNSKDPGTITASKVTLGSSGYAAIKRAPDQKVYCASSGNAINVINFPNLAGQACQYTARGFPLRSGTGCQFGLPNLATIVINRKINTSRTDTVYCSDSFLLQAGITNGVNYTWQDDSTGNSRYIRNSGTYWVSYQLSGDQCDEITDTFHAVLLTAKGTHTRTSFEGLCAADTFLMVANRSDGTNYIWEDGSTGRTRKMNRTGHFWVSYQNDSACEYFVDTFILQYPTNDFKISFNADTVVCQHTALSLQNTSDPRYHTFRWFLGDGRTSERKDEEHTYIHPGTYEIILTGIINDKCRDTATQVLHVDSLLQVSFDMDRDKICVGEYITVTPHLNSNTIDTTLWYWGDEYKLNALNDTQVQHAYDRSGIMPVTLRMHFRACPVDSFMLPLHVYDPPRVHLTSDQGLCYKGIPLTLRNLQQDTAADAVHFWSTGSNADSIQVTHPGSYSLTLRHAPPGCSTTETIEILKDCFIDIPNAFSPNDDGVNDYFFPRQRLGEGIAGFTLQVFNRWGVKVYETSDLNGRGWDGRFNGKNQVEGVYIYAITLLMSNGAKETYQGNVTLIR